MIRTLLVTTCISIMMPITISADDPTIDFIDEEDITEHNLADHLNARILEKIKSICDEDTYTACQKCIRGEPISVDELYRAIEGISCILEQEHIHLHPTDTVDILEEVITT